MNYRVRRLIALYIALTACAIVFAFPFYWVVSSSLKSREGLSLVPPSFYPSETRLHSVTLPGAARTFSAEDATWFRLAGSTDRLNDGSDPGAYYVRLNGDTPSQLVAWFPNAAVRPAELPAEEIAFDGMAMHRLREREDKREVAIAAKMVRKFKERTVELLFIPPNEGAGAAIDFEILENVKHREIRDWHTRWENYAETLRGPEATIGTESIGFLTYMRNSFFISIMAVIGQVLSSSLVAFGFSRLHFRGREVLFIVLLATLLIPGQVTLIPLFFIYKQLGWIDSFLPLIVPHFTAGAFNVFLVRQYMLTLPLELDESAAMDGCGPGRTFFHIILPNCVPVLIVVGLFTFVYTWQDVMGPLIYLDNPLYRTVTLGLEYFRSPYVDNRHLLMTGAVLAMLPVALLFLILQRYIMSGIATTGIKG